MKCTLNSNIKNISGKFGNLLFRTYTKPDGTKETRAYGMPKRKDGSFGYQRKAAFTEGEIKAQAQFKTVSAAVNSLSEQSRKQFHREWQKAKYKFNGKKYVTLRGYIMARLYAEMKDGVNLI